MTSLVVVDLTPMNKEKLAQYSTLAADTLKPFGGNFIAKGEFESLHGEKIHPIKAIIEFPNKQAAKSWYESEAYQAIIPLRNEGMNSQFHCVELLV